MRPSDSLVVNFIKGLAMDLSQVDWRGVIIGSDHAYQQSAGAKTRGIMWTSSLIQSQSRYVLVCFVTSTDLISDHTTTIAAATLVSLG